jgi:hypothetical protein
MEEKTDRVHRNHFHKRDLYHKENIQRSFSSQLSQDKLSDSLPLKETNFSLNHEISSVEVPQTYFTPYVSILPQKRNSDSFKRDTIIYIHHEVTSCDKDIICEEEEKNDNGAVAIIIETKNNYDDNYLINEDSIIYERITDCVLGYEEKEKDDKPFKLCNNVDKRYVENFFLLII